MLSDGQHWLSPGNDRADQVVGDLDRKDEDLVAAFRDFNDELRKESSLRRLSILTTLRMDCRALLSLLAVVHVRDVSAILSVKHNSTRIQHVVVS